MNKVILIGRLTREPEIRYSQGQNSMAVARYTLAVDRRYKRDGDPTADFFNCTAFDKNAEFVERYLHKGMKIAIVGRIQNDNYTDRNGNKVYSVQIFVDEHEFCESKAAGQDEQTNRQETNNGLDSDGFMNIPDGIDEELPFN